LLAAVWTLIVVQIKRKAAEAEVKKSDERFRTLIEKAPIPIAMAKDLKLVYCNSSFVKMYGYDNEEEIKGLLIDQMVAPEYRKTFLDRAKNRLSGLPLPVSYEAVGIRKNCQEFPLHITASILDLPDGSGLIGFFQDMSERKRMETELIQLANTDFLTDIPNRRHFMELASRELAHGVRYGNPLSMLMMDVDLFKQINDNYGHKTGDIVLIKLADLCRKTLREVDIVGRLGGEEFAILLPETTGACAFEVAERLRKAIHSMVVPLEQGELLRFTVSIGVTLLKGREESVETLINRADSAMYRAKQSGRNTVCMAADHKHE